MRDPASQQASQSGEDHPVEDGSLCAQAPAQPVRGVQGPRVGDRGLGGQSEDLLLGAGRAGVGRVVDLLEYARYRDDEGRAEGGQVRHQVLHIGRVPEDPGRRADDRDLDESSQHMGQGQEQQRANLRGLEHVRNVGDGVDPQVDEIAVSELDALGTAGCARGVDDRGQVRALQIRDAGVEVGTADAAGAVGARCRRCRRSGSGRGGLVLPARRHELGDGALGEGQYPQSAQLGHGRGE